MTNVKNNERFIPLKNYFLAIFIVVGAIALVWYGFAWYNILKENKISKSYLVKEKIISKEINDLNEVADVFSEAPKSYFIYVSYTGNEEIYNNEKGLKTIINSYNLNDSFYYLNVTSIKDDDNYIDKINEALNLDEQKIINVPTIIYYENGKVKDLIVRKDNNFMTAGDFQKLLDINRIEKE